MGVSMTDTGIHISLCSTLATPAYLNPAITAFLLHCSCSDSAPQGPAAMCNTNSLSTQQYPNTPMYSRSRVRAFHVST